MFTPVNMKKVGVVIVAVLLLSALSIFVSAQEECATGNCVDSSECRPDEQCTSGCCEPIPCESDIDCPIPCPPPEPGSFAPTVCNTCVDGFCEDPCSCDYGTIPPCGGSGPCLSGAPKCVAGDCEHCVTDCDCSDPNRAFSLACPGAACSGPFGVCSASKCYRSPPPGRDVCSGNTCITTGTPTCAASCAFNTQCADGNPCTDDTCSSGTCVNTNNAAPCTDDGNPCTDDVCSGGACTNPNNSDPCDADSDDCTQNDACSGGSCLPGAPVVCSECQSCNPANGNCQNDNDLDCDDSLFCTGVEDCMSGNCDATGNPCDQCTEVCNEDTDVCDSCGTFVDNDGDLFEACA